MIATTQAVRERGLLFSAPMMNALIAGRKTMTRRPIKVPRSVAEFFGPHHRITVGEGHSGFGAYVHSEEYPDEGAHFIEPPFKVGDRFYAKETHAFVNALSGCEMRTGRTDDESGVRYRATWEKSHSGKWRPSIFLPKWAARFWAEVTEVRPERLADISEEDARAEGVEPEALTLTGDQQMVRDCRTWVGPFARLWDSIHGSGAFAQSPWVWRIAFKRIEVPRG